MIIVAVSEKITPWRHDEYYTSMISHLQNIEAAHIKIVLVCLIRPLY